MIYGYSSIFEILNIVIFIINILFGIGNIVLGFKKNKKRGFLFIIISLICFIINLAYMFCISLDDFHVTNRRILYADKYIYYGNRN